MWLCQHTLGFTVIELKLFSTILTRIAAILAHLMLKVTAAYDMIYVTIYKFSLFYDVIVVSVNKHDSPRSEKKHWLTAPFSSFLVKKSNAWRAKARYNPYILPPWMALWQWHSTLCWQLQFHKYIQKNPDDDMYHQISRFTCTQKFQGPGKTCRMTKVKSQFFYKITARSYSWLHWHFKICLERSWNWTKPKHSWGDLSDPKTPLAYIKF